jgi:thioredoxin 1
MGVEFRRDANVLFIDTGGLPSLLGPTEPAWPTHELGATTMMTTSLRRTLLVALLVVAAGAGAAPPPYDEAANAAADVERAMASAAAARKPVLLIFGANWCEDCRALDAALKSPKSAALMKAEFVVVKIDVGHFDRNIDLSARYGDPIKKGIPAAVVVSPAGKLVYATRAGELADARSMSETGVYDFFRGVASSAGARN